MTVVYTAAGCDCFTNGADVGLLWYRLRCLRYHPADDFAWHARPVCLLPVRARGTAPTVDSLEDDIRRQEPRTVRVASDGTVEYRGGFLGSLAEHPDWGPR